MIAQTFYKRGIIETWGRGTLKIGRLMRDAGLKPPTVTLRPGAVVVTFSLPEAATGKTPLKTPLKTAEAVLVVLREEPHLSLPTIAKRLRKSDSAVKRAIRRLREDGRLERVGPDKGGYWKVIE